ncbi:MAG: sulfotransferase family 2 domain-containing protein [Bacteroidales bacterium]|nr:sulfotransferase family 2 domain-containing protein [Bacteroidales bacterium]
MIILSEEKILYCHIHKNAGKSVRQMFKRIAQGLYKEDYNNFCFNKEWNGKTIHGHASFSDVLNAHNELNNFIKLAVIRNPYDRLASAYHWFKKKPENASGINSSDVKHIESFEEYVKLLYQYYMKQTESEKKMFYKKRKIQFKKNEMVYPLQCSYLLDKDGNMLAGHLIYFEDLENELRSFVENKMCKEALQYFTLEHSGPSNKKNYESYYTPAMKNMVKTIYSLDFDLLGY